MGYAGENVIKEYKIMIILLLCLTMLCFTGCSSLTVGKQQPVESTVNLVEHSGNSNEIITQADSKATGQEQSSVSQLEVKDNKGENPNTTAPWLFGQTDIYIYNKPVLNSTSDQLSKHFGKPLNTSAFKVNPPATEPDFYNYFNVWIYEGFECEFYMMDSDRGVNPEDEVFRFDITSNSVVLDCGLKTGMTVQEILNKFGGRDVYNLNDTDESSDLNAIKHVLRSFKPKDCYTGYSQAMIIYADQDKFDNPLAKAVVLLINKGRLERIVFGYPTAG